MPPDNPMNPDDNQRNPDDAEHDIALTAEECRALYRLMQFYAERVQHRSKNLESLREKITYAYFQTTQKDCKD
jgi:hypothetical protein